ncbi:uncharacterized protein NECHADRAFT_75588 [Fusarium vanettenii 77-13-4]|uniref:C2H2-type domain-containing protein n=1 Tax=Fusarium vanettenii (strain ATCC MYA-4622 / CBS 123669 / FGSC 9596 / NRRL 45880 / 77-13-4) TaxID=660122 RepID=C7YJ82_FUSV7|nr:uncharacterized protein NECHADRAFT_75588 [Fusarium vanettenii 77-13-4]EEU48934.1 hypothetical protein NECHADRAFT_75588 [Fusarium vanettenii 77-13-4]
MGVSAVASKPLGVAPRPIHFEMNLSTINDKSYDHRKIIEAGFAPSNITLGNGELRPTSKALVPRHVGSVVLAKNGLKLCYDVIAFNYIAVHLFECMSAAYFFAFKDDPQAWINLLCEAKCTDVDINNQVSSCAGSAPQTHGHKRHNSGSGGGEPKKQRSNNRGQDKNPYNDNNFNNADDDYDSDEDSDRNHNIQKPNKDEPPKKNLACPFQKLYPGRFPECEQRLLTSWDRVYQHLKRHHLLKKSYCARCRKRFEDKDDVLKDDHIRRGDCQKTTAKETGLLLTAEYNKLKKLGRGTDEDKYKEAWGRLFSEEPCPKSFLLETELEMLEREAPDILAGFPEFDGMSDARKKEIVRALFRRGSAPIPDPTPPALTQTPDPDPTSISQPTGQGMGTNPVDGQAMAQASHGSMPYIDPAMMAQLMALQAPHHATSYDGTPSHQTPYQSDPYHSGPYHSGPYHSGQFSALASSDLQGSPGMSTSSIAGTLTMPSQVQMNPQAGHGQPPNGSGSIPPWNSDSMTGRPIETPALTEMPGQVPMNSTFGFCSQSPGSQNHLSQGQLSYLDSLPQTWSGSMQAMPDSSALDNFETDDELSDDLFNFGTSEGHDELDRSSD